MTRTNKWAKLHLELEASRTLQRRVHERLGAAMRINDPALMYCEFCHRVIGWHGIEFRHGCEQQGDAFFWTDIRRKDERAIAEYEIPGTLWYKQDRSA